MDSIVGRLIYQITGDSTMLSKDLSRCNDELKATSRQFADLSVTVRTFARRVVTGVLVKSLADAASELEELESKFNTVFGDNAQEVRVWAENYATSINRGVIDTEIFMAMIQDIQTGYGMAADEAAKFSQAVVGVTNDLASFSNIPFSEAMAAMQSGLAQQFEALRRLGVGISVEIINQSEYAKALGLTWLEMDNLQRQTAILNEIVKQSPNALHQSITSWEEYNWQLGDAARTSDSYVNTAQGFTGALKDFSAELGQSLLPTLTDIFSAGTSLLRFFEDLPDPVQAAATAVAGFGTALAVVGTSPLGIAVSAIAGLAVLFGGLEESEGDLEKQTDDLALSTSKYRDAVKALSSDTSDLTAEQRLLYEAQRDLARADALKTIASIPDSYREARQEIDSTAQSLESYRGQMAAWALIAQGDALSIARDLAHADFKDESEQWKASFKDVLQTFRNEGADYANSMVIRLAEHINEIEAGTLEAEAEIRALVIQVASAMNAGLVTGDDLLVLSKDLQQQIRAACQEIETGSADASAAAEDAAQVTREWRTALLEIKADMASENGDWDKAWRLRAQLINQEKTEAIRALAEEYAALIANGEDISTLTTTQLKERLNAHSETSAELAALEEYYTLRFQENQETRSAAIKAEQDEARRLEEEEKKRLEDLARAREDYTQSLLDDVESLRTSMREDEADALVSSGKIGEGFAIRRQLLQEEYDAEIANLDGLIAAQEASESDRALIEERYRIRAMQLREEEAAAYADVWQKAEETRLSNTMKLQDQLASLQRSAREDQSAALIEDGNIEAGFAIRRQLLKEEYDAEIANLNELVAAQEASESDRALIEERYRIRVMQLREEETDAYVDAWQKAEDERLKAQEDAEEEYRQRQREGWNQFFSSLADNINSFLSSMSTISGYAADERIAQIEREEEALLQSLGLQEESERERIAKELKEAEEAGDAETAAEKAKELERLRIQEETDAQIAKIEREQAEREKRYSIFQATIDTLASVVKFMVDPGGWAGVALSAMAAATGAAQIAAIQAQPLPSYDVGAVDISEDHIAQVHQGEMIIPKSFAEGIRNGDVALGGSNVQIEIHNYTGSEVTSEESEEDGMRRIRIMIGSTVESQIAEGRFDRALGARYGTRRAGRNG